MAIPDKRQVLLYNYLLNVKQFLGFDVALIWDRAYSMLRDPSHKDWRLVDRKTEKLILNTPKDGQPDLPPVQRA